MNLTFSPADDGDIGPIFSLSKDLIDRYEQLETIDYPRVLAWVRRKIEGNIAGYTCIHADGAPAGYYRFCENGPRMELDDLYILPPYQNRGIGTAIIKKCCQESDRPVMLYVFVRNTGAVALYQRLGFRITETVGVSRYIMEKDI